jgi:hypothetical protein
VEFREVAPAGQVEFAADDPVAIKDAALAYQAQRAAAGQSVSIEAAVEHVTKRNAT